MYFVLRTNRAIGGLALIYTLKLFQYVATTATCTPVLPPRLRNVRLNHLPTFRSVLIWCRGTLPATGRVMRVMSCCRGEETFVPSAHIPAVSGFDFHYPICLNAVPASGNPSDPWITTGILAPASRTREKKGDWRTRRHIRVCNRDRDRHCAKRLGGEHTRMPPRLWINVLANRTATGPTVGEMRYGWWTQYGTFRVSTGEYKLSGYCLAVPPVLRP